MKQSRGIKFSERKHVWLAEVPEKLGQLTGFGLLGGGPVQSQARIVKRVPKSVWMRVTFWYAGCHHTESHKAQTPH